MRRTTFGLAGLVLLVLTGSVLFAQGFAPAQAARAKPPKTTMPTRPPWPPPFTGPSVPPADTTPLAAAAGSTLLASTNYKVVAYSDGPNGHVVGQLAATTWGGPTVRPVVQAQGGWLQVRLDSRPNGSTGWVSRQAMTVSSTDYRIVISVSQRSLTLYKSGMITHAAPVGVGRPQWPTPLGSSFVDAIFSVMPSQQYIYGPIALITASHSNVFTEFEGGDGTVAIHAYPSDPASTAGVASSHGCIRASAQTIAIISQVPAGTPIDIVA